MNSYWVWDPEHTDEYQMGYRIRHYDPEAAAAEAFEDNWCEWDYADEAVLHVRDDEGNVNRVRVCAIQTYKMEGEMIEDEEDDEVS